MNPIKVYIRKDASKKVYLWVDTIITRYDTTRAILIDTQFNSVVGCNTEDIVVIEKFNYEGLD